jgi:hypothetical protein
MQHSEYSGSTRNANACAYNQLSRYNRNPRPVQSYVVPSRHLRGYDSLTHGKQGCESYFNINDAYGSDCSSYTTRPCGGNNYDEVNILPIIDEVTFQPIDEGTFQPVNNFRSSYANNFKSQSKENTLPCGVGADIDCRSNVNAETPEKKAATLERCCVDRCTRLKNVNNVQQCATACRGNNGCVWFTP